VRSEDSRHRCPKESERRDHVGAAALVSGCEGVQRIEGIGAELGETEGHGTPKAPASGEVRGLAGDGAGLVGRREGAALDLGRLGGGEARDVATMRAGQDPLAGGEVVAREVRPRGIVIDARDLVAGVAFARAVGALDEIGEGAGASVEV